MGMFEKTNIYRLEKIIKYLKVKYVCWNALKLLQKKKKRCVCWAGYRWGGKRQGADQDRSWSMDVRDNCTVLLLHV